jgi:hypothetical protein
MRFVLVNGRTPFRQISCVRCREPIGAGYLRDVSTRLCYCDAKCYAHHHCEATVLLIDNRARASRMAADASMEPTYARNDEGHRRS